MQIEGLVKVMPSGYIQIWQIMLTNVGEVPLKINLKPASGWSPGQLGQSKSRFVLDLNQTNCSYY